MINITAETSKTIVIVAGQKLIVTGKAVAYLTAGMPIEIYNQKVFDGYTTNTTITINAINSVSCLLLEADTDLGIDLSAINFTFSNGTSSTTVLDTSTVILDDSTEPVYFVFTAGAGVTASTDSIEAATDQTLTAWVTLGSAIFSAAGIAQFASAIPYFAYRLNVINVSGGAISATLNRGVNVGNVGNVITNPVYTGIPVSGSKLLAQSAIPILNPASATAGSAGAFTSLGGGSFPLPNAYAKAWIFVPTGAYVGLASDVYYAEFTTNQAGKIYNILLSSRSSPNDLPSAAEKIANPITQAAGTWTVYTTLDRVLYSIPIPAGSIGTTGMLRVQAKFTANNSGTSAGLCLGVLAATTADHNIAIAGNSGIEYNVTYNNRGVANSQITTAQSSAGAPGLLPANLKYLSIDTSVMTYINLYGNAGGATAGVQLESYTVELIV